MVASVNSGGSERGRACRSLQRSLVAPLVALSLAGCMLGGEKPDPALEIPPVYRDAGVKPDAFPPKPDWWRDFRSKELSALVEEAQVANLDIAVAVARIVQADAQAQVAGAPLLPGVTANGNYSRSRSSQSTGGGGGGASERDLYQASLNASYEIDFWGKNRSALRASDELAVATRFDREVVALSTTAAVANAYFQVLAAQDRLAVAQRNLTSANRILDIIRQRLSVGTTSELEVAQQESVVATQRAAIPPLRQTLRQQTAVLAVLIGRPPEAVTIRGGSMSRISIPRVTPGLPSELLTQRPDIREAEAKLASANANVESARAAFFPSIQLTSEFGYQSAILKTLFLPQSVFYTVAGSLTQPIFDGFRLKGQYDLQRGLQEELLQTYRKTVISAFADVDSALVAVQETSTRESLQRDVVNASRRAFELAERRLREGTVDLTTVLTTQQTLFQAEDALAQTRLLRLQAIVSLFQSLGGGWLEPDRETAVVVQ
jgi:NodT family efflux transporter outer membrane factor (OMF) lipoprotein